MSPGYNNRGRHMHQSTLIVLMFLTLGQIFMLTCGVLVMWLAGEFGEPPKLSRRTKQAGAATIATRQSKRRQAARERSMEHDDRLMTLADDHSIQPQGAQDHSTQPQATEEHSIQPQATEDRADQLEDDVEH